MGEPTRDFSSEDRLALGQTVLCLLSDWGLNGEQQVIMLGLDSSQSISLDVLMRGEPLPEDDDVLERASRFLNLSLSLNALYDYNSARLSNWMLTGNDDLGGQTPYAFIREYGVTGLAWLEDHLGQKQSQHSYLDADLSAVS